MNKSQRGFTLIELMVVVAIMGVLLMFAVPTYQNYALRGNRTLAKGYLSQLAAKQESVMLQQRVYATTFAPLNGVAATTYRINRSGAINSTGTIHADDIYFIELVGIPVTAPATATQFTLRATAVNRQLKDKECRQFTLSSLGQKTATNPGGASAPDCWR